MAEQPLLDYVLQHFGKCLVELGELDRAEAMFEEALQLRRQRGDEGLVASTRQAIDALERMRTASGSVT